MLDHTSSSRGVFVLWSINGEGEGTNSVLPQSLRSGSTCVRTQQVTVIRPVLSGEELVARGRLVGSRGSSHWLRGILTAPSTGLGLLAWCDQASDKQHCRPAQVQEH